MNKPLSAGITAGGEPPTRRTADLLALSVPLLILLAVLSTVHRTPALRLQTLPALLIGSGLLLYSWLRRRRRRSLLLRLLREPVAGPATTAPAQAETRTSQTPERPR